MGWSILELHQMIRVLHLLLFSFMIEIEREECSNL